MLLKARFLTVNGQITASLAVLIFEPKFKRLYESNGVGTVELEETMPSTATLAVYLCLSALY